MVGEECWKGKRGVRKKLRSEEIEGREKWKYKVGKREFKELCKRKKKKENER